MDGKLPSAFRTIGEVSRALMLKPHVLRYWEEQFPMLRPVKRAGGRRLYRPQDVTLLALIDRLVHTQGYTLRGARQWLEGEGRDLWSKRHAGRLATEVAEPAPEVAMPQRSEPITVSAAVLTPAPMPAQPVRDDRLLQEMRQLRARLAQALSSDEGR
ncbi:MerR family transcriptional regulator [Novosphingobium sp. FSY-8]|uniref:MerR family transcriptional regulator n=2 Tax=Novosphingobium ovatum TaxID=1908523 RepID=A0ABW9XB49_9SPHN|nr:MerR family transcriptional regulator [Novosphingobium ovatum]